MWLNLIVLGTSSGWGEGPAFILNEKVEILVLIFPLRIENLIKQTCLKIGNSERGCQT